MNLQIKTEALSPGRRGATVPTDNKGQINFRSYQERVFWDESGTLVLHWSRQVGKSFVLAAWAVYRIVTKLKSHPNWLVTVLSNSRDNGAEFCRKAAEASQLFDAACEVMDTSPNLLFENMRMEIRITRLVDGQAHVGRIKVLAANPRTARGFSGDLILDEFAFHENSAAIWEAAEPILAANREYLCRIASTGNGRHNLFFRIANGSGPNDGTIFRSSVGFALSRVARSAAYAMKVPIFDAHTRAEITPEEARRKALDKRAYDQNYECLFNDENMCLLTHELIQGAEADEAGDRPTNIDENCWSQRTLSRLQAVEGPLFLGGDIGRNRDLTVLVVLTKSGPMHRVVAVLRLAGQRLPQQQAQLDVILSLPKFQKACLDMTGIGLGLVEYAQERWGHYKVQGVNFASTEPISARLRADGSRHETARVTEIMATDLLGLFEDRAIRLEVELDEEAREDLRKPEKITSPGGRVSIAAQRNGAGHADHFWALALAVRAAQTGYAPFLPKAPEFRAEKPPGWRNRALAMRRYRGCV